MLGLVSVWRHDSVLARMPHLCPMLFWPENETSLFCHIDEAREACLRLVGSLSARGRQESHEKTIKENGRRARTECISSEAEWLCGEQKAHFGLGK